VGQHKGIIMVSFYHEERSVKRELLKSASAKQEEKEERFKLSHMAVEVLFRVETKEMEVREVIRASGSALIICRIL
jgi:hypothetical protein